MSVASNADAEQLRELYLNTFDNSEAQSVCQVALDIVAMDANQHVSLVSKHNNIIVGHIAFTILHTECAEVGYILAPLAVAPPMQKRGIGSALVQAGIKMLSVKNTDFVIVYGDPAYYARFGFEVITTLKTPFPLNYPHGLQLLTINNMPPVDMRIVPVQPLMCSSLW